MAMKKTVSLKIILLFVIVLSACTQDETEGIEGTINPGDEINGMKFTNIDEMDWEISLAVLCDSATAEETNTSSAMSCHASPGSLVFFGNCAGVWFDNLDDADKLWQEFDMEVTFDGQLLNLTAFGYLDIELPESEKKYARIWNLMVENITSGTHIIECKEKVEGEIVDTRIFNFIISEQ